MWFYRGDLSSASPVPLSVLRSVLKYLYTGNTDLLNATHAEALAILEEEFGIPNSLESDVSFLLETLSLGGTYFTVNIKSAQQIDTK